MKLQTMALLVAAALISPMAASAQSVTGHVNFTGIEGAPLPPNQLSTLSFSARTLPDGTVKGQVQIKSRYSGLFAHGEVVCMVVDENQAWLAGVITQSDDEDNVGATFLIGLADNGEGINAEPDVRTAFGIATLAHTGPGFLDYVCWVLSDPDNIPALFPINEDAWGLPLTENDGGNIQIRP
jgi:hypothetical protein